MFDNLHINLLKTISLPGQYINSELNSETETIKYKWNKKEIVKVCLCYPDKYVIGMSNLGIEILYKLLNTYENILCERVYTPDVDMEQLLNSANETIVSLETNHKLTEFDIIGFSLQHELCYTNIFTILSLAKIPFRRIDRKNIFPLIIAGGHCSCNPEVLSDYIDCFILGEAEESLLQLIDVIAKYKKDSSKPNNNSIVTKQQLILACGTIDSVYIPDCPDKKVKPSIVDIKKSFYPEVPTVPLVRTTHLRLNIELTRGCGYNCNFCQAGYIHKPLRYRDKEYVMHLIEKGIKSTGYDELSFTGFCVTNYPYLLEVIDFVNKKFDKISISLPSLRIEDINEDLIEKLSCSSRKSTITLAPEAATERLRKVINKEITTNEIFEKIFILYKFGFKKIKLYFMIGLPTETEEDIEAIPKFVKQLYKTFPEIRLNLTVSIFVPKPHTPFQFVPMNNYDVLYKKLKFLSKQLKQSMSSIDKKIYSAFIEALISRGDKQIGKLIETVWDNGARFDNWKESFNPNLWVNKIRDLNIEFEKYIFMDNTLDSKFSWDNIVYSFSKEKLYNKYQTYLSKGNQIKNNSTYSFSIPSELVCDKLQNRQKNVSAFVTTLSKNLYTLRLRFGRRGKIKFISYLDQLEIIKRTFRMVSLPVTYSTGFNPQIKMSLGIATPVGYESNSEYVDVELNQKINMENTIQLINQLLPQGMYLINTKMFSSPLNKIPALNNIINIAEYVIKFEQPLNYEKLQKFFLNKNFVIEKCKNSKIEQINLHDIVKYIELKDKHTIYLLQRIVPRKTLRVEEIISTIFDIPNNLFYKFDILRENLYIETYNGNLLDLMKN